MKRSFLGKTDIEVSKLCFGSLTISPLQANFMPYKGGELIEYAFSKGINFIDTAELYDNYAHIRHALKKIRRRDFVIATKSYAYSKDTAKKSLDKALNEIDTDYIDIFLLHEQESINTIRGHYEAIEYFLKAKEKGIIRAIGLSTHFVQGVEAATKYDEIEIIHPILNKQGIGIQGGTRDEMIEAIEKASKLGKGIYGMKSLGGGHLIKEVEASFNFVKAMPFIQSIAVGMQTKHEVDANCYLVQNGHIPIELKKSIEKKERQLHIADWCVGCGKCVAVCQHGGIEILDAKAKTVHKNCVLCGYCAKQCPEFCIKVI